MENHSPTPSSSSVPAPNAGQLLACTTELLLNITRHFTIEPDVTTRDETEERTRDSLALCRVSWKFHAAAVHALYEIIDIQTTRRLQLLYRTVQSNPEIGEFVRKLFVDLRICLGSFSGSQRQILCGSLYGVLNRTMKLQLLSLDLKECTDCFRIIGPGDFGADESNYGYHNFYKRVANRIRDESRDGPGSRTFLPKVEEFRFSSDVEPYMHDAFFGLPSLNCIVSLRDTMPWSMILRSAYHNGTRFFNIKKLLLRSSASIPPEINMIAWFFPNLEVFKDRTNSLFSAGLAGAALTSQDLSPNLARMGNLRKLALDNFPTHLGPANGITSLGGMPHLTKLRLGIHHLMCYGVGNGQLGARPLAPSLLPPALRHLQLYTCFSCWDKWVARLWRGAWQGTVSPRADLSTLSFIVDLSVYVTAGSGLPGLETVRLYSQNEWWGPYGEGLRTVRHFKEENGQTWKAGLLGMCCELSRFEDRRPGIHFRAYKTDELDC